jgi:uncharacterized protein (DUF1499 family)
VSDPYLSYLANKNMPKLKKLKKQDSYIRGNYISQFLFILDDLFFKKEESNTVVPNNFRIFY